MNESIIKKSIAKNELHLNFRHTFEHYLFSVALFSYFLISVTFLLNALIGASKKANFEALIYMTVIPITIAILLALIQKKRLRFKVVVTELDRSLIDKVIDDTALQLNWVIDQRKENYVEASTNPGFLSGSWGEQITIIFDGNRILVNSICDLSKKSSVVSMGRNKKNEQIFIKNLKSADSKTISSISQ